MRESLDDRIRQAMSGKTETLARLLRERHPAVIDAMLHNPNMPLDMVLQLIRKKVVNEDHIHAISTHKEWRKDYTLKLELILNPLTPRGVSLKFMRDIRLRDLAVISRRVTLHPMLREVAVNLLKTRLESMRVGEKITLAKTGPIAFLHQLMEDDDNRILDAALWNFRITEDDIIQFITPMSRAGDKLDIVLNNTKWGVNPRVLHHLASHPGVGYAARQQVFRKITIPYLLEMTDSPILDENHRKLAVFVLKQRLSELDFQDQLTTAGSPSRKMLFYLGCVMKAPAVVRIWLRNPAVTAELCDRVVDSNSEPEVREWVRDRRVPARPEPPGEQVSQKESLIYESQAEKPCEIDDE